MSPMTLAGMKGETVTTTHSVSTTADATVTVRVEPPPRRVGWVGLGKLGLTCAATMASRGVEVTGFDVSPWAREVQLGETPPPAEDGIHDVLSAARDRLRIVDTIGEVVSAAEVVFVAVQTPHAPAYGGETERGPFSERRDFEYGYLAAAVASVAAAAAELQTPVTIAVVSTVLPGTCHRLIKPLMNEWTKLVYNPLFIAMGTTVGDYLSPEFVLLGADDDLDRWTVEQVYHAILPTSVPYARVSIEDAELAKVAYNTYISMKIVFANTIMEICHKTGADADAVVDVLELATDRVISPRYLRGGMGDGGHCHPRDLIAMSWLAQRLGLSYDLLGAMALAREAQSRWLAEQAQHWSELTGYPIAILGKAYKPESPLTGGSPALLLADQLARSGEQVELLDMRVNPSGWALGPDGWQLPHVPDKPHVYVVATKHPEFAELAYPAGSVVLDPWGYIPDQPGVVVVRIGRKH